MEGGRERQLCVCVWVRVTSSGCTWLRGSWWVFGDVEVSKATSPPDYIYTKKNYVQIAGEGKRNRPGVPCGKILDCLVPFPTAPTTSVRRGSSSKQTTRRHMETWRSCLFINWTAVVIARKKGKKKEKKEREKGSGRERNMVFLAAARMEYWPQFSELLHRLRRDVYTDNYASYSGAKKTSRKGRRRRTSPAGHRKSYSKKALTMNRKNSQST